MIGSGSYVRKYFVHLDVLLECMGVSHTKSFISPYETFYGDGK